MINFTEVGGSLTVGENGIRVQKETEVDVWESTLTSYNDLWDMGILQAGGGNPGSFSDWFAVEGSLGEAGYKVTMTEVPAGDPDPNFDGFVDGLDLGILLGEWNPAVAAAMGVSGRVPKPTTAVLLLVSLTGLLVARRR